MKKLTQQDHNNAIFDLTLDNLVTQLKSATLGNVEHDVIDAAGHELINCWNKHNPDTIINEEKESRRWNKFMLTFK